jgi:RimJ/RimL family protein N-acetyltransferase
MIPSPIAFPDLFETPRLHIRAPRPGDGLALNAAIRESYASLHVWMPWALEMPTLTRTEDFVRDAAQRYAQRQDFSVLLWERASGLLVGGSRLHPHDWNVPMFEIGYWVRSSREGQGYITEAVQALTRAAFDILRAQRVVIRCDARNLRSARVAERAGYTLEATLHHDARANDGSLRNTLVYARLADERV